MSIVFRTKTIATIDHHRRIAEIAVPASRLRHLLAEHDEVQPGPLGVTVHLTSPSRARTAVELIRRCRDAMLYGWQWSASSP